MRKRLFITILTCMLSLSGIEANAARESLIDDFDHYSQGATADLPIKGDSYEIKSGHEIVKGREGFGNAVKFSRMGRLAWSFRKEVSDGKLLIGLDFMCPSKQKAELFLVTDGGTADYDDTILKITTEKNGNIVDSEGVVVGKYLPGVWYNIQVLLDMDAGTAAVRMGDEVINTSFAAPGENSPNPRVVGRVFSAFARSSGNWYIDNVEVSTITNDMLDTEMYRLLGNFRDHANDENAVFSSAYTNYFKSVYEKVKERSEASLDTGKQEELIQELKAAYTAFENGKTDIFMDGTFHLSSYNPSAELEAYIYDVKTGEKVDGNITITAIGDNASGVKVDGKCITIDEKLYGKKITLMAQADDGAFITKTFDVVQLSGVRMDSMKLENGKYRIEGGFDTVNSMDISLSIKGDTIDIVTAIIPEKDNSFIVEGAIAKEILSQPITVTFSGKGMAKDFVFEGYYYGADWREVVLPGFNVSDKKLLKEHFANHIAVIDVSNELYNLYQESYIERIIVAEDFATLDDFETFLGKVDLIYGFDMAVRNTIEDLITDNLDTLKENGFAGDVFEELRKEKKSLFYTMAAGIRVDSDDKELDDICLELNEMLDEAASSGSNDGSGGSGGGGGGSSFSASSVVASKESEKSSEKLTADNSFTITPVVKDNKQENEGANNVQEFDDINEAAWAAPAIMYLRSRGIMEGYENKVRPNDKVTRAEFTRLLVSAFSLEGSGEAKFADAAGMWYENFANIAAENGIVSGFEDGTFKGDSAINREMMAVMIKRIIDNKKIELYEQNESREFKDTAEISDYAKEAVEFLFKKGIVAGKLDDLFAPALDVTRAEAAQVIYNVLIK